MYNLEQLRMFAEAADGGSFSASARALGKVQSAVSQGIANLEIDLGVALFDRTTRKPRLTAEGERLLGHARAVLQQAAELEAAARGLHAGEETLIRLVLEDALLLPRLSDILTDFGARFRATAIEIVTAPSPDIARIVKQGRADIGLMFSAIEIDTDVDLCFIGNLPFHAVCRPDHPLAGIEPVEIRDLVPHRQILVRGEAGSRLDLLAPLSSELWWTTSFNVVRELALQGVGWAYLPAHLIDRPVREGRAVRLNLSLDHKPWSPPVDRVLPKNRALGPARAWLSEALTELLP